MKIRDLLKKECIELAGTPENKESALNSMVDLMARSGKILDVEAYRQGVFLREAEGTTGIGNGIAIPHCKSDAVKETAISAMVVPKGVEFDSIDKEPVTLIFMIAASNENIYFGILSKLSVLLLDEEFRTKLCHAVSQDEFLDIIDEAEEMKAENRYDKTQKRRKLVLAVTGCPTGIAHTYMAAEALEKQAMEMDCDIKVETRGSSGVKNEITEDEIKEAEGIIIASDISVPMERFAGKQVIVCKVADGISRPKDLLKQILAKEGELYSEEKTEKKEAKKESFGHKIYTHLMNGVSYMLPFVVGGGILLAIAFLIDGMFVDVNTLSMEERANFGKITEAAALFKGIGDLAFGVMLPILSGYIAMSIADRPGLAVGFVGGAIAAAGTSGFLGALAAGYLAGYFMLLLKKILEKLPKIFDGMKPILLYPVLGILCIGVVMIFAIEPSVGALNTMMNRGLNSLNGSSAILLGAILAGMMSVDMGGPVNKAAYLFGSASIAAGNYNVMAAVMVGGMVPATAIGLATIFFKNKFTKEERKAGPTNIIMGLSFITEGAIPYAAADPLHVIPACVIGSGIAGALSMTFDCTLMAPHGGIFVVPTVGNPLFYLLSWGIGALSGCLLLGILKKRVNE